MNSPAVTRAPRSRVRGAATAAAQASSASPLAYVQNRGWGRNDGMIPS